MQNAFAFDWMFDFLSLGTTYLYRKYMIGAVLAGENGAWRRLGSYTFDGPEKPFDFEKFNEAYPDFVRGENLRLRASWPETIGRLDSNVDDEDRSLRTQSSPKTGGPAIIISHTRLSDVKEQPRLPHAPVGEAATTLASCLRDVSAATHTLGEVYSENDAPPSPNAERKDLCLPNSDDMIAGQPISQFELIGEKSVEADELLSEYDIPEEHDNDLLRALRRDPRNLVLDSVCPRLAPHIVVTPPKYTWEDYFIPMQNRVDPQWRTHLAVPPQTWHAPSSNYVSRSKNCVRSKHLPLAETNQSSNWGPLRIFSHEEFEESVLDASHESAMFPDLVTALRRHQAKANAFHASRKASWFRERYDSHVSVSRFEQPFKWKDSGEAVLSTFRRFRGSTIIDSPAPFTIPHIVISEPPPQNPWISCWNHPSNPQDCQWGARLTVPGRCITYVNPPPSDSSDAESDSDSDYGDEEDHFDFVDYIASGGMSPRLEAPVPATPLTVNDQCETIFTDEPIQDEGPEFASFLGDSSLRTEDSPVLSCDEIPQMVYEVLDDEDEEDDLPPFDDWYTSVQSRMQP